MSDISITALPLQGMITLRGDLDTLAPALRDVLGCDAPAQRLSVDAKGARLLWMSSDELLVTCAAEAADGIAARLTEVLGDGFATVAVVSDARRMFAIAGQGAEAVLSRLMPVDFATLAPEEVRRTRMAQNPAAFWREGATWRLVCFQSVAAYAEELLRNAAEGHAASRAGQGEALHHGVAPTR